MRIESLSKIGLVVIFVLTIVFGWSLFDLKMDYRYETFFPTDNEEVEYFKQFSENFESDNDYIFVGLENKAGIFEKDFLSRVAAFSDSLESLEYVVGVISPTKNLDFRAQKMSGLVERPYLRWQNEKYYKRDSVRIYNNPQLVGSFFSEDRKAVTIFAKTEDRLNKKKSDQLLKSLKRIENNAEFDGYHISARIVAQSYFMNKLAEEMLVFIGASILLLIVFLWFTFRTVWGVVIPLLAVIISIIWTLAIMHFFGKDFDLLTALLPTIIFVVGMSDIVYILSKYIEELRNGAEKMAAIKLAFKEVGFATFLTSLTTAVGFFALLTAAIQPIKDFGLYAGVGVFVAYLLAFTLLPAVLINTKVPEIANSEQKKIFWISGMTTLFSWVLRNRKSVWLGLCVVLVISAIGISKVKINNFLLEDLSNNDPVKKDFLFFEDRFSGVRPFEMTVEAVEKGKDVFDYEVLVEMDKIEKYLVDTFEMSFVVSPLTLVKEVNKISKGGHQKYYRLPESQEKYLRLMKNVKKFGGDSLKSTISKMTTDNKRIARISGKMKDLGGAKMKVLGNRFDDFAASEINSKKINYHFTGTARVIDLSNESLATNMLFGLSLAFIVVGLIVGVMYKSLRMVVLSLVPNLIPMLMIAGIMGWFGIDLKVSTSLIFTIAFGIAVDDTIHMISKLKLELGKGKSMLYALKRTYISTGKALLVTSVILVAGFLTLIFSTFTSTFYIGVLVSLTLLFALAADLFILPLLLIAFFKKKKND